MGEVRSEKGESGETSLLDEANGSCPEGSQRIEYSRSVLGKCELHALWALGRVGCEKQYPRLIPLLSAVAVAGAVAHSGLVRVEVEDRSADGIDIFIPFPALAIEAALLIAPLVAPHEHLTEIRREAGHWTPALLEAVEQFEDLPDVTLVEVHEDTEHVRVRKVGSRLEIEVEEPDLHVEITLPLRTVRRSVAWIMGTSA